MRNIFYMNISGFFQQHHYYFYASEITVMDTFTSSSQEPNICIGEPNLDWLRLWLAVYGHVGILLARKSPKIVALFSATNFSSYIIKLLKLHDAIQIKWSYAEIHHKIAITSHLMI